MDRADLLVLQYPMWWHLPPAMLKGWFDRVLAYGAAYTSSKRFENGRFVGKRAMLSVTVGTSRETYMHDGRSGDIELMLWPVNFTLAYAGFTVLEPFVAYGVEAGPQYSDPAVIKARLKGVVVEEFRANLQDLDRRATIPFNRKAEWGADGRIIADAPVYSPFIRSKEAPRPWGERDTPGPAWTGFVCATSSSMVPAPPPTCLTGQRRLRLRDGGRAGVRGSLSAFGSFGPGIVLDCQDGPRVQ